MSAIKLTFAPAAEGGLSVSCLRYSCRRERNPSGLRRERLLPRRVTGSNRPRGDAESPVRSALNLLSKSDESYKPDMTASIADTSALACAATLSTGRFNSLAGKGAA